MYTWSILIYSGVFSAGAGTQQLEYAKQSLTYGARSTLSVFLVTHTLAPPWLSSLASLSGFRVSASTCRLAGGPLYFCRSPALPGPRVTPAPCLAGSQLSAVPPGWLSWGIPPGSWKKQLGPRERPSVSPGPGPPPGLGVAGPRQEALRFLASPRRPPDLAPTPPPHPPGPTAQILFRRRSRWRWRREEARVERGFQGSQAWGFLSPGSGLTLPHWGPQVA